MGQQELQCLVQKGSSWRINTETVKGREWLSAASHWLCFSQYRKKNFLKSPYCCLFIQYFIQVVFTYESPALLLEAEGGLQSCVFSLSFAKWCLIFAFISFYVQNECCFFPKCLLWLKVCSWVSALKDEIKRPPCASKPLSNFSKCAAKLKEMCINHIIY